MEQQLLKALCRQSPQDQAAAFSGLTQWELKNIMRVASATRRHKYDRRRDALYGRLPRAMSLEDLRRVVAALPCWKLRTIVLDLLFPYALRVGEIHKVEVLCGQGLLRVGTQDRPTKTGRVDYLPVYTDSERLQRAIRLARGFHPASVSRAFRKAVKRAGVGIVYARSRDGRSLNQFTTHSVRHTAISLFGDFVKDEYVYTLFSRHDSRSRLGVVATYRHVSMDRLRVLLKECFAEKVFVIA
jgi:hypothetical protein